MAAYTEVVSLDTADQRWRQWQTRGRIQDRKSAMRARILAAFVFSGLLGWLFVQVLFSP